MLAILSEQDELTKELYLHSFVMAKGVEFFENISYAFVFFVLRTLHSVL